MDNEKDTQQVKRKINIYSRVKIPIKVLDTFIIGGLILLAVLFVIAYFI